MGYDVGVYNSYGRRSISCSSFLRCSESEPFGDRRENKRVSAHFKLKSYGARAMSVRSPNGFLRSPYDGHTMLGVRPSFVYYQTCTISQYIMAPPKGKCKRSKKETPQHFTDEEDEPGEKQAACTERQNLRVFRRPALLLRYMFVK